MSVTMVGVLRIHGPVNNRCVVSGEPPSQIASCIASQLVKVGQQRISSVEDLVKEASVSPPFPKCSQAYRRESLGRR